MNLEEEMKRQIKCQLIMKQTISLTENSAEQGIRNFDIVVSKEETDGDEGSILETNMAAVCGMYITNPESAVIRKILENLQSKIPEEKRVQFDCRKDAFIVLRGAIVQDKYRGKGIFKYIVQNMDTLFKQAYPELGMPRAVFWVNVPEDTDGLYSRKTIREISERCGGCSIGDGSPNLYEIAYK